jgi:hypothetical protein
MAKQIDKVIAQVTALNPNNGVDVFEKAAIEAINSKQASISENSKLIKVEEHPKENEKEDAGGDSESRDQSVSNVDPRS